MSAEHVGLTERQRVEASVYDDRVRARIATLADADLRVAPDAPPYPNREHVDFLSFALGRLGPPAGRRILEVGCGTGALAAYLALRGAQVDGIDVSSENVALASRRARLNGVGERARFRAAPIESLGDADDSYDAVLGNQVMHHFELEAALRTVRRLLRPGGRALFCEPVLLVPDVLRRLRDTGVVKRVLPKLVDTPTERSLSPADVRLVRAAFPTAYVYAFQLLVRAHHFVDLGDATFERLRRIDEVLLRRAAPLRLLCRFVVFELSADPRLLPATGAPRL